jgi:hypothetical protein
MNTKIYAIFDNKAEAFMQPYFATTPGLALRAFSDGANNKETTIGKYPNDFVLYEIGQFDDQTGELENYTENKNLGIAIEYTENELRAVK